MTKPQSGVAAFLKISRSEALSESGVKENSNPGLGVILKKTAAGMGEAKHSSKTILPNWREYIYNCEQIVRICK